ncbi:MAG TPA: DNA methyltransferase [Allosphingosinicella sp.]|nr:DNA methyltransferase [Allosphingosinicella sp.]
MRYGTAIPADPGSEPLDYLDFVKAKAVRAPELGLPVAIGDVHPLLHRHQPVLVKWLVEGGRRALFANFGLGKTMIQLEAMRLVLEAVREQSSYEGAGSPICLIVIPLTVVTEFKTDAAKLGIDVRFVRTTREILDAQAAGFRGLYLTNYESVREGKIDTSILTAVSLDEASCLRGFGGTKTFREFMKLFDGVRFKFVATATPSPNEYIELLAYAAFLEVMDVGQAKTRFFKRNSEKADALTIHPHKEAEFWLWVNSWAAFIQRPSDLGFSDEGYDLPPLDVRWHEVPSDHRKAGEEVDGQRRLLKASAIGIVDAAREKRDSLGARIAKMLELCSEDPGAHRLLWHDLEDERRAIEAAVPNAVSVYGAQDLDDRERAIIRFSDGDIQELAAKPILAGSGCNFQRHCAWAIFLGIGFKFNDFIQAIHRIQRFLQTKPVRIDLIFTEAERSVRASLEGKWKRHEEMCRRMSEIIRTYGLGLAGADDLLGRSIGVERREAASAASIDGKPAWQVINQDTVIEAAQLAEDSLDLIVTSEPFSTQYEYTPSYNDFGHTDNDAHYFAQMDYLLPELVRALKPGRMMCFHVKDRIRPGGLDGVSFQSVSPFHAECIAHRRRHGLFYMGMITVVTDVVRENNATYRLGWSMQCDDGSRMSVGMPEYVLLFRKPPTDTSDGYADEPVKKTKAEYSRARWQLDAHALWKSRGDRLLEPEELLGLDTKTVYRMFRGFSAESVYDYDRHVAIAKALDDANQLPTHFMTLKPVSRHPDVWSDVTRMRTLNGVQVAKGRERHLCPLQFDIVDRLINRFSNPGELVYDPFGGLMTVPLRAVRLGRRGLGVELNSSYFDDGVTILREADQARQSLTLFDLLAAEEAADPGDEDVPEELEAAE